MRRVGVATAVMAVAVAVAGGAVALGVGGSSAVRSSGRSPAALTAHGSKVRHYEYVLSNGAIYVYSVDRRNRLVQTISLPVIGKSVHGVVAYPRRRRLYISYGGQGASGGSLLAYDLRHGRVLWRRRYPFGIDSMAISRNGRLIYMPAGEFSSDGSWRIIAAANGRFTGRSIAGPAGAHNTILGPDGRYLYLGGVDDRYLEVADTNTDTVVRKIGPLNPPGVRPFTINGSQTLAFTTARGFLGFQVSSIDTGKVLYTVPVPGFSFNPKNSSAPRITGSRSPRTSVSSTSSTPPTATSTSSTSRVCRPRPRSSWRTSSSATHHRTTGGCSTAATDGTSTSAVPAT